MIINGNDLKMTLFQVKSWQKKLKMNKNATKMNTIGGV
jgi:hypothetical protein